MTNTPRKNTLPQARTHTHNNTKRIHTNTQKHNTNKQTAIDKHSTKNTQQQARTQTTTNITYIQTQKRHQTSKQANN